MATKDADFELLEHKMKANKIQDVDSLILNGSLIFMHNEDWYIPD
jgi:hypothetical protein